MKSECFADHYLINDKIYGLRPLYSRKGWLFFGNPLYKYVTISITSATTFYIGSEYYIHITSTLESCNLISLPQIRLPSTDPTITAPRNILTVLHGIFSNIFYRFMSLPNHSRAVASSINGGGGG